MFVWLHDMKSIERFGNQLFYLAKVFNELYGSGHVKGQVRAQKLDFFFLPLFLFHFTQYACINKLLCTRKNCFFFYSLIKWLIVNL